MISWVSKFEVSTLLLCLVFRLGSVDGHGRLLDPPARGTMWRLGFDTPANYDDHALFCGGYARQWEENKGRCGVCGDPWDLPRPRPNESGGTFGTGIVSRVYHEGQEIVVTVHLTANHLGWFEFRLCDNNTPKQYVKQSCLNKHVLELVDYPGKRYEVRKDSTGLFRVRLRLPGGVTCSYCVIQWHYTSGNNWGYCTDGKNKQGCGPQEVFRGCSDVAIFPEDDPNFHQFKNLSRKIDQYNALFFDGNTGHYDLEGGETENKKKEKISVIQSHDEDQSGKSESKIDDDETESKIDDGETESKIDDGETESVVKGEEPSLRDETNKRLNKKTDSELTLSRGRGGSRKKIYEKVNQRNSSKKYNKISTIPAGKYKSSDSFRKSKGGTYTKAKESMYMAPSRRLRMKSLSSLINQPKVSDKSSEIYLETLGEKRSVFMPASQTPGSSIRRSGSYHLNREQNPVGTVSKDFTADDTDETISKLSKVFSLLVNLTSTSSSKHEVNKILDKVSRTLANNFDPIVKREDSSEVEQKPQPLSLLGHKLILLTPTPQKSDVSTSQFPLPDSFLESFSSLISSGTSTPANGKQKSFLSKLSFANPNSEETEKDNFSLDIQTLIKLQHLRDILQQAASSKSVMKIPVPLSLLTRSSGFQDAHQTEPASKDSSEEHL